MANEVGFPVESFGALVTLILPLFCVHDHMLPETVLAREDLFTVFALVHWLITVFTLLFEVFA